MLHFKIIKIHFSIPYTFPTALFPFRRGLSKNKHELVSSQPKYRLLLSFEEENLDPHLMEQLADLLTIITSLIVAYKAFF
jgi:hypothetical protein